jgi:NAD(P)-dependent dehydrogenase (short-subunit alcohol dehydrogenase family)
MKVLDGKVAVVTGAASGIGFALARRFVDAGMRVALADVEPEALQRAFTELNDDGATVIAVPTDVSNADAVEQLAAQVIERFGAVHVVCNNAGVGGEHFPTWDVPLAYWEWLLGVNLWGVIHGLRSFVPHLVAQGEGHVVNTSSIAGLMGVPYIGPYVATKHAIVGISEALFHELAMAGSAVRVSVLCPGGVATRFADAARNWPSSLGAVPESSADERAQAIHDLVRSGTTAGVDPTAVADQVIDAIHEERFMVLTEEAFGPRAIASLTQTVTGGSPLLPLES